MKLQSKEKKYLQSQQYVNINANESDEIKYLTSEDRHGRVLRDVSRTTRREKVAGAIAKRHAYTYTNTRTHHLHCKCQILCHCSPIFESQNQSDKRLWNRISKFLIRFVWFLMFEIDGGCTWFWLLTDSRWLEELEGMFKSILLLLLY